MKLKIENININNHHLLKNIAGIAGYVGSIELIDETTSSIDLMDASHREKAGIKDSEIQKMLHEFNLSGFSVSQIE